jgi:hypothetical protein
MATLFKNKLYSELGIVETTVLTTESNAKTTVIGLSLTNLTDSVQLVSIRIVDTVSVTSAYYIKDAILPPNQSLRVINGGERLVLGPSTEIKVDASTDESLDLVLSYVEIV